MNRDVTDYKYSILMEEMDINIETDMRCTIIFLLICLIGFFFFFKESSPERFTGHLSKTKALHWD